MRKIVVLGAGRSSYALIEYLHEHSQENDWQIEVGDIDIKLAQQKTMSYERAEAFEFDVNSQEDCRKVAQKADLVVSLLPAFLHVSVAQACVEAGTSMFTASYVSTAMQSLDQEATQKNILLLNEIGLDPGIDHLSAMQILDKLRQNDAHITAFRSFTGGLLAPESDDNPWNYKFTWNPRNVVLAGQGTAKFIQNHQYKYVPYHRLFSCSEPLFFEGVEGAFEGYPNRDSLQYRSAYGLDDIPTMLRGTIRRKGFSDSWNTFVQLGMTDDTYRIENSDKLTYRQFVNMFFQYNPHLTVEDKLRKRFDFQEQDFIKWNFLGLLEEEKITLKNATPAQVLQHRLEEKWSLSPKDKDMIVMQHQIKYRHEGISKEITSSLVVFGEDSERTAMAKTVGLPVAIAARLYLTNQLDLKGVQIPLQKQLYDPILSELEKKGVVFKEQINIIEQASLVQ